MDEGILRSCGVLERYLACDDSLSDSSILSAIAEAKLFDFEVSCKLLGSIAMSSNSDLSLAELDTLYGTMREYEMHEYMNEMFKPEGLALTLARRLKDKHIDVAEFALLISEPGTWKHNHAKLVLNELFFETLV